MGLATIFFINASGDNLFCLSRYNKAKVNAFQSFFCCKANSLLGGWSPFLHSVELADSGLLARILAPLLVTTLRILADVALTGNPVLATRIFTHCTQTETIRENLHHGGKEPAERCCYIT